MVRDRGTVRNRNARSECGRHGQKSGGKMEGKFRVGEARQKSSGTERWCEQSEIKEHRKKRVRMEKDGGTTAREREPDRPKDTDRP